MYGPLERLRMLMKISPEEIKSISSQMYWASKAYEGAIIICFYQNIEIGRPNVGINQMSDAAINQAQEMCCMEKKHIAGGKSPWFSQIRYNSDGTPYVA